MLWFNKIKEDAKGIFKEHPASIISMLVFCLSLALQEDIIHPKDSSTLCNVLVFFQIFSIVLTFGLLVIESNYGYKKAAGKIENLKEGKKAIPYVVMLIISLATSAFQGYLSSFFDHRRAYDSADMFYPVECFTRFLSVYIAVCILGTLYFMYKKTGESFEGYSVKAFLGSLKALAVYGVVAIGMLCILWVFSSLIVDFDYIMTVELIIAALVGFPALLVGLSRMGEKISRFSEIMVGYVFTGLLAVATVIVYVYIIKIVVTWTFPSNEAYSIMTALFATGIVVWTMAQGCTEGKLLKVLNFIPVLYAPFIIVQTMCLAMRINQYGITAKRYLGIMFIVFEVVYLVYYIIRKKQGKGLAGFLFPVALIAVIVYFIVPGINVYAAVTNSQKAVIEKYAEDILQGNKITAKENSAAWSAYNQITGSGSVEGRMFMDSLPKKYPGSNMETLFGIEDSGSDSDSDSDSYRDHYKHIYANHEFDEFDVSEYDHVCIINSFQDEEFGPVDPEHFALKMNNGERITDPVAIADLTDVIDKLSQIYDEGEDYGKYSAVLAVPIELSDDSVLYITHLQVRWDDGVMTYLDVEGYYCYR